jgi:hypothetical protein
VYGFGRNIKFLRQLFHQCLCNFYLQVSWADRFVVGYNTDKDGMSLTCGLQFVIEPVAIHRILPLPSLGWLYLAVTATEPVTDNKMAVDIFGISQAAQKGQLLNIAGMRAALVNFDVAPVTSRLGRPGQNSFFDRDLSRIAGKTKCAGRGRIITQGLQDNDPHCH